MPNPFLAKKSHAVPYIAIWITIAAIHMAVLFYFSDQDWLVALTDSLVYNLIFGGVGIAIWFAIRYHDNSKSSAIDLLIYHLATGVFAVGLWLAGGYFILKFILPDFDRYKEFLDDSLPWRAISGILFYSLMTLVYYLHIQGEDRKRRKEVEDELQIRIREAEIDRLKAQINPHFLFNSLNSISSLTISKPESAREMVVKLSHFLRYSLEFKENELTSLESEVEHIRQYLDIEKVRFGDRLQFEFLIPTDCSNCQVPNMILQPLLENAIKHGVYESLDPVMIETKVKKGVDSIEVSVKNSFDPEAPPRKGRGIGLQNVSNRLRLVYQAENLMHVKKLKNEFEVRLFIPQIDKSHES